MTPDRDHNLTGALEQLARALPLALLIPWSWLPACPPRRSLEDERRS